MAVMARVYQVGGIEKDQTGLHIKCKGNRNDTKTGKSVDL